MLSPCRINRRPRPSRPAGSTSTPPHRTTSSGPHEAPPVSPSGTYPHPPSPAASSRPAPSTGTPLSFSTIVPPTHSPVDPKGQRQPYGRSLRPGPARPSRTSTAYGASGCPTQPHPEIDDQPAWMISVAPPELDLHGRKSEVPLPAGESRSPTPPPPHPGRPSALTVVVHRQLITKQAAWPPRRRRSRACPRARTTKPEPQSLPPCMPGNSSREERAPPRDYPKSRGVRPRPRPTLPQDRTRTVRHR